MIFFLRSHLDPAGTVLIGIPEEIEAARADIGPVRGHAGLPVEFWSQRVIGMCDGDSTAEMVAGRFTLAPYQVDHIQRWGIKLDNMSDDDLRRDFGMRPWDGSHAEQLGVKGLGSARPAAVGPVTVTAGLSARLARVNGRRGPAACAARPCDSHDLGVDDAESVRR